MEFEYSTSESKWQCKSYMERIVGAKGIPTNMFWGEHDDLIDVTLTNSSPYVSAGFFTNYKLFDSGVTQIYCKEIYFNYSKKKKYYRLGYASPNAGYYMITLVNGDTPNYGDEMIIELDNTLPSNSGIFIVDNAFDANTGWSSETGWSFKLAATNMGISGYREWYKLLPVYVQNNGSTQYEFLDSDKCIKIIKFVYSPSLTVNGKRTGQWKELHRSILKS